jgi:hypothetical protein
MCAIRIARVEFFHECYAQLRPRGAGYFEVRFAMPIQIYAGRFQFSEEIEFPFENVKPGTDASTMTAFTSSRSHRHQRRLP